MVESKVSNTIRGNRQCVYMVNPQSDSEPGTDFGIKPKVVETI